MCGHWTNWIDSPIETKEAQVHITERIASYRSWREDYRGYGEPIPWIMGQYLWDWTYAGPFPPVDTLDLRDAIISHMQDGTSYGPLPEEFPPTGGHSEGLMYYEGGWGTKYPGSGYGGGANISSIQFRWGGTVLESELLHYNPASIFRCIQTYKTFATCQADVGSYPSDAEPYFGIDYEAPHGVIIDWEDWEVTLALYAETSYNNGSSENDNFPLYDLLLALGVEIDWNPPNTEVIASLDQTSDGYVITNVRSEHDVSWSIPGPDIANYDHNHPYWDGRDGVPVIAKRVLPIKEKVGTSADFTIIIAPHILTLGEPVSSFSVVTAQDPGSYSWRDYTNGNASNWCYLKGLGLKSNPQLPYPIYRRKPPRHRLWVEGTPPMRQRQRNDGLTDDTRQERRQDGPSGIVVPNWWIGSPGSPPESPYE